MLSFAYPWLLALLPVPLLVWWLVPAHREPTAGLRVPFLDRLARLTGLTPTAGAIVPRRGWLATICLMAVWVCIVVALARPQWLEPPITRTPPCATCSSR